MKIQEQKFRIKVIERNDGTKMYYPQAWVCVDVWRTLLGFGELKVKYDWRSFTNTRDGVDTLGWDDKSDGAGSSDLKFSDEMIEKYKIDLKARHDASVKKDEQEYNEKTKAITFIEINKNK